MKFGDFRRNFGQELKLSEGKDDYILDLRGFILAFSGRVLLKKAALSIRGGHCYGIVGQVRF